MDGGHCIPALQLAIQLCRSYLIEEKHRSIVTEAEFSNTLETLARVYQNRQNPEGYVKNFVSDVSKQTVFLTIHYCDEMSFLSQFSILCVTSDRFLIVRKSLLVSNVQEDTICKCSGINTIYLNVANGKY